MRKMLKASSLLICAMLLFSACAGSLNLRPGPFRSEMQDVFVQQTTLTVPASHAEHGEDYVIEWQDPVMEKHVRKWLDRPKGDIYHSDVWDYQRVSINSGTGVGDLIVKDAPDGVDIGRNVNSNEQLAACAVSVEGTYDPVTSLADLRHFDSLQVLSVNNRRGAPPITDLTGLEECKNLMLLSVPSVESSAFPTFAKLDSVVELKYGSDGIRADSNVSDLSALAQMKSLKMLWITGSEVDLTQLAGADLRVLRLDVTRIGSLEPLKQMENLSFLQLCQGPEIDSFAPLAESSVQYLSMSLSQGAQETYKDMDYTPLTQMPQLIWLDLTNNITFDTETCKRLLANDTALKYLKISYTSAANAPKCKNASVGRQRRFFYVDSQPLQGSCVAAFQCGHAGIQRHGQQDAQQYINAAVLLEQNGGRNDGHTQYRRSRPHPAAARRFKDAAAVVGHHQGDRVEHMDGGADIEGRVGGIEHPHGLSKDVAAVYPVGPQVQAGGQDDIAGQRNGHARKQGQAEPPEVGPGRFPQQVEQGERDPYEPRKVGHDGIFAKGDQVVQMAVHQNIGHGNMDFEPMERRKVKQEIKRHERNGMAGKPVAHGTHFLFWNGGRSPA